jgi:hypothetical protein
MATEDKRRQFEQIVERLQADYPSLARRPGPQWSRWSRPARIMVAVLGALVWGLLSVAMVAWGVAGVVLAVAVVAIVIVAAAVDAIRHRG